LSPGTNQYWCHMKKHVPDPIRARTHDPWVYALTTRPPLRYIDTKSHFPFQCNSIFKYIYFEKRDIWKVSVYINVTVTINVLRYIVTVYFYDTLVRYTLAIHWYDKLLRYIYDTPWRYMECYKMYTNLKSISLKIFSEKI
jgi:hypothetical protein